MDPETNVCYGEGGAGLFSDGKLITRIKSDLVSYVMEKFVAFGAPPETAYESNPHLGSNKIRTIITQISNWLRAQGTELRYNTKVTEIISENGKVTGVKLSTGEKSNIPKVLITFLKKITTGSIVHFLGKITATVIYPMDSQL